MRDMTAGHRAIEDERDREYPIPTRVLQHGVKIEQAVTINREPEELFRFWRDFRNLPHFMDHLESVTALADGRTHWKVKALLGASIEWDALIINEVENELIAWGSDAGAEVPNAGSVRFRPAPGNRGTEVKVSLDYQPPGGRFAAYLAQLFGEEPGQQLREDLRRFKQLMEAGEIPTTRGQPSGPG